MAATQTQQPPVILPQPLPLQMPSHPTYSSQATLTPPDSDSSSPREQSSSPLSLLHGLPTHLQLQTKQLRSPRSPMYVPAVLRPTEKPARQSPPKQGAKTIVTDLENSQQDEGEPINVRRVVTEEWNETRLGEVTGPPSRNHWKVSWLFSSSLYHVYCHIPPCDGCGGIRSHCQLYGVSNFSLSAF